MKVVIRGVESTEYDFEVLVDELDIKEAIRYYFEDDEIFEDVEIFLERYPDLLLEWVQKNKVFDIKKTKGQTYFGDVELISAQKIWEIMNKKGEV